ncbi:MAG: MarR family transcriptional regulator [Actinobacteria bacterium]|nr:MarR family transcriptional regulator [Actinomycetota bacterium]
MLGDVSPRRRSTPAPLPDDPAATGVTPWADYEQAVALYTAAGGQESVQRVVTAISRLGRRLDVFYRDQFEELGLSHGEWTVLSTLALDGRGGGVMPSRLADICGVSPSTMTHRLDRMVERGLVARSADPDNRARSRVVLADAGWELFRRAVLDAEVVESRILSPLDAREQRQLAALLEKVVAGLKPS